MKRYLRQQILKEVGVEGQSRLAETSFCPPSFLTEEGKRYARLYAERAGLRLSDSPNDVDNHDLRELQSRLSKFFRHTASRDLGIGAAVSLHTIILTLTPAAHLLSTPLSP